MGARGSGNTKCYMGSSVLSYHNGSLWTYEYTVRIQNKLFTILLLTCCSWALAQLGYVPGTVIYVIFGLLAG